MTQTQTQTKAETKTNTGIDWTAKQIQFRYSISYVCLFRAAFRGKVYNCPFGPSATDVPDIQELPLHLTEKVDFAAISDLRIEQPLPRLRALRGGLLYCLNQTQNYFIGLEGSFESYLQLLSSNTRSTAKRKVRKFAELSGRHIDFRVYSSPAEMHEFHKLARGVASRTYQEKLFQGALPETAEFSSKMERLASEDQVRGYLLFLEGRPVAYLYIPLIEDVAEYEFLGYEPDLAEHSPGTVLLYLAIQDMFRERRAKYFNFGYGVNQNKIVFSTGQFLRADVYLFKKSFRNWIAVYGHTWMDAFSESCGRVLDRIGLRRVVKGWLRSM